MISETIVLAMLIWAIHQH